MLCPKQQQELCVVWHPPCLYKHIVQPRAASPYPQLCVACLDRGAEYRIGVAQDRDVEGGERLHNMLLQIW